MSGVYDLYMELYGIRAWLCLCGNEKVVEREQKRSKIRVIKMDNFSCLSSIRRIDRIPNARAWIVFGIKR